jgi:hypothetical protein
MSERSKADQHLNSQDVGRVTQFLPATWGRHYTVGVGVQCTLRTSV